MSGLFLKVGRGERILLDGIIITIERVTGTGFVHMKFTAPGKRVYRERIAPPDLIEACNIIDRGVANVRKAKDSRGASDQPGHGPSGDHGDRDGEFREGLDEG